MCGIPPLENPLSNPDHQNTQSLISGAEKSLLVLLLEILFVQKNA